jgi:outer membrane protein
MKKNVLIFLCSLLGVSLNAQDTVRLDLKQCIDIALKNNIDLYRTQTSLKISDQNLYQSRGNFLPSINGYISQGQNAGKSINPFTNQFINQKIITGQYGLSGNMNLWSGFSNYNTMRQNAFSNNASQMDVEQAKLDLVLNILTLYLQVLSNEETLVIATSQKDLSQQQVDRLMVMDKSGAIAPNVLYDAKGQLSNDKLSLIDATNGLDNAKTNLLLAMNYQELKPVKLEKINISEKNENITAETLNQNALQKMPLIKASEYRTLSSRKNLQSARGNMFPTLSLNASLGSNYSGAATKQFYNYISDASSDAYILVNNTKAYVYTPQYDVVQQKIDLGDQVKNNLNSYIGLNLQIPILNSLRTKAQMGISKANYQYALAQNKTTVNRLGLNIKQAYANMIAAKERLETIKEQSDYYNESFKIAVSKFEKGAMTTVDYTFAKNNSNRANLNQVVLKYDYYLKLKTLEYYSGQLVF